MLAVTKVRSLSPHSASILQCFSTSPLHFVARSLCLCVCVLALCGCRLCGNGFVPWVQFGVNYMHFGLSRVERSRRKNSIQTSLSTPFSVYMRSLEKAHTLLELLQVNRDRTHVLNGNVCKPVCEHALMQQQSRVYSTVCHWFAVTESNKVDVRTDIFDSSLRSTSIPLHSRGKSILCTIN